MTLRDRLRERRIDRTTDRSARRPHGRAEELPSEDGSFTAAPEAKGSPAAPFSEGSELVRLPLEAGFREARAQPLSAR